MSPVRKSDILKIFKAIHKTRKKVFQDDYEPLNEFRQIINESFQENKNEIDPLKIEQMYNEAVLVEEELRTKFIQTVELKPGHYQIRIRPDNCVESKTVKRASKKNEK